MGVGPVLCFSRRIVGCEVIGLHIRWAPPCQSQKRNPTRAGFEDTALFLRGESGFTESHECLTRASQGAERLPIDNLNRLK